MSNSMASANVCPVIRVKSWAPSQGEFVEINKEDFDATRHELFEELPAPSVPVVATLPPPPPLLVNPLANLPKQWRDGKTPALRDLAERATGRTPETREQAIQMIEAALSK